MRIEIGTREQLIVEGDTRRGRVPKLVTLDSRNCVDASVVVALRTLEETGIKQYKDFVQNVLEECIQPKGNIQNR